MTRSNKQVFLRPDHKVHCKEKFVYATFLLLGIFWPRLSHCLLKILLLVVGLQIFSGLTWLDAEEKLEPFLSHPNPIQSIKK